MILYRRLAAVVILIVAFASAAHAETTKVTFILVNDMYQMSEQVMPDGQRRGGFARLAAVVKAERAKGGHVLFVHAGDTLSPSLMSSSDRGAHIITLTNLIPPDVFVPGNHEFDFGKANFFQRMSEAKFPVFAANLRGPDGKPLPDIKDRTIVTYDGVRIGLTGAAYDETPRASSSGDLKFLPTVDTVKEQASALRREGADFVAAVIHADRKQGTELVAARAADLVLSGHNHDLFLEFDGRNAMVESAYDAIYVTMVDVTIDVKEQDGRRETTWWPQFRIVDTANVTPDPEVAAEVAKFEQKLSQELDLPLAGTAVALDSRNATVRSGEAAIGNLVADAIRASTKADAAVINGGGIRAGKFYPPGTTLTRRDMLAELPFGNRIVAISISGRELRAALENGVSRLPEQAGRFPQVSGIAMQIDPRRPAGRRIVSIRIGNAPLNPSKRYRVATIDFLARGGDGYMPFAKAIGPTVPEDAPLLTTEVIGYLGQIGTVRTGVDRRIVFK
jgi:2',3'-cyclic-nucleotide 2'-phosphodiesterase (5'-nucleotidase family)